MNHQHALRELAETIKSASDGVNAYYWQISGDEPNSLCRFLGMSEEELKTIFRVCKIYDGKKDNFSKNNFERLVSQSDCQFSTTRLKGKVERFIKIGKEGEFKIPQDMFDKDGNLECPPTENLHIRRLLTKSQRGSLPMLVDVGNKKARDDDVDIAEKGPSKAKPMKPRTDLLAYILDLFEKAVKRGDNTISNRDERSLRREIRCAIDIAAKDLLHGWLEKYASIIDGDSDLMSPQKIHSSATIVTPSDVRPIATTTINQDDTKNAGIDNKSGDTSDATSDEDETLTANAFVSEMREEVLLQSLLYKRIHDKKERVFQLEHRNGRRLLVVLPPDTQSVATFEEEATKTNWVNIMLNTNERVEGMLSYLAKFKPDQYVRIGQKKKLSMRSVVLNTSQTMALARVGRLNDVRMKWMRSFLRNVGQVVLEMSVKEQQRIDIPIGRRNYYCSY